MLSTRFGSSPNSNIIIYSYLRNSIYYYNRVSDHIQTTRSVREDNFLINRCTLRVKVNKTFIVSVASCARAFATSRAFQSGSGALGAHACVLQADLAGFFLALTAAAVQILPTDHTAHQVACLQFC